MFPASKEYKNHLLKMKETIKTNKRIISCEEDIENNYIVFRPIGIGIQNLGIESLEKIFFHFGIHILRISKDFY